MLGEEDLVLGIYRDVIKRLNQAGNHIKFRSFRNLRVRTLVSNLDLTKSSFPSIIPKPGLHN